MKNLLSIVEKCSEGLANKPQGFLDWLKGNTKLNNAELTQDGNDFTIYLDGSSISIEDMIFNMRNKLTGSSHIKMDYSSIDITIKKGSKSDKVTVTSDARLYE